jgi:tRNA(Ile)-lysidine synthase
LPVLVIAVSGGPDSMALLHLLARWRAARKTGPKLIAVTVDHGLRAEAAREALLVKKTARTYGIPHRTLHWHGAKPKNGLQEAARAARYWLLGDCARKMGAAHVLTAHTRDDQAETVLMRLCRGSGITGLAGMAPSGPGPAEIAPATLVRPFLDIPKMRLLATLAKAKVAYAHDPSNEQARFTRVRLRAMMDALAQEGLTAPRLALLAQRARRADAALEATVDAVMTRIAPRKGDGFRIPVRDFAALPAEIALRLLGRVIRAVGGEGPAELAKLEALSERLRTGGQQLPRRTLAGAMIGVKAAEIVLETAPPRRAKPAKTQAKAGFKS